MPEIDFDVSGGTITATPETLSVSAGDEVQFSTNETVYVTFGKGAWPFDEPQLPITVNPGIGAGPYTVSSSGTLGSESYTVSTELQQSTPAGVIASGEIDIG
jgi:hypothetical protein